METRHLRNNANNLRLIRPLPWISSDIFPISSPIHGDGVSTNSVLEAGTVVMRFGGQIFSLEEVRSGQARNDSATGYAEGLYVGVSKTSEAGLDELLNHSCDPNVWLVNPLTLVARRKIHCGEELTADYATWEIDDEWYLPDPCQCKSSLCRVTITGRDWNNIELQHRYAGHILPCLAKRFLIAHPEYSPEEEAEAIRQPIVCREENKIISFHQKTRIRATAMNMLDAGSIQRGRQIY